MSTDSTKWTEIEHLPEWDEEFYLVYTAKKHDKWVMLKTLRPEYRDKKEYQEMIAREFAVRYNLSHPNIVMINDFEDVPGVGMSIITDDVYGDSLAKLIREGRVTSHHIKQLRERLPMALEYIEANHIVHAPLRPETIIFTENIGNLKLIDVGFEQRKNIEPRHVSEDMAAYGRVVLAAMDACKEPQSAYFRKVAKRCAAAIPAHQPYRDMPTLQLVLGHGSTDRVYRFIIGFLVVMLALLIFLTLNPK